MNQTLLRRSLLRALGAAPAIGMAQAQTPDYPNRPLRVVVPYAPGGGVDVTARLVSQPMAADLRQQLVIDNRTGANTAIGAEYVARARPDGYTIFVSGSTTFVLLPLLSQRLAYRPTDFAPVAQLTKVAMAAAVNDSVQGTLPEIIARIRQAPADFIYGHTGMGSSGHLMGERLFMTYGLRIPSAVYRGFSATAVDMMAGRIPMTFESVPAMMPFHREGKVRIVAVSSPERLPDLPDVPTFLELGFPGMAFWAWFGMVAPAGTPAPVIQRLARSVAAATADPEYRRAIEATGQQVATSSPEEFGRLIEADTAQWRAVVEPLHISLD
ncbi:MAG TPA: tripartite tricarboxylate transporter substrate binding protein [Roseomonas sp.]